PEHYEVAVNLSNLAGLLRARGHDAEAERFYRQALAMREQLLGPEHPEVALTANNLAVLLKTRGDCDEAAALYRRALAIFERATGPDHPHTVTCRENQPRLLGQAGCDTRVLEKRGADSRKPCRVLAMVGESLAE